jgi:arabinan endo-1,5-alpha-L-arabinosidase
MTPRHVAIAAIGLILAGMNSVRAEQPLLSGNTAIHDPSVLVVDGHFVSFATGVEGAMDGGTPRTKISPDGLDWTESGSLPGGLPAWTVTELGYTPRNLWAPSISIHGGVAYLYYSASRFGVNDSAIGLMTNPAFDPLAPTTGWLDQGLVLRSHTGDNFNAIDPFRIDTGNRAFLAFGSFWDGIRLVALDPAIGKPKLDAELLRIASRNGGPIEAPSILEWDGRFYLFVSFDFCCRNIQSTYRIMVGRADAVEGPYLDRDGRPMLEGGGTELIASTDRRRGPGGGEVFRIGDESWLAWHYYDFDRGGAPQLQISRLHWSDDGWPFLDPEPQEP